MDTPLSRYKDVKIEKSIGFEAMEIWVQSIDKKLDNHLAHVQEDIGNIKNDVEWLKKFFWIIATSVLTSLIATILSLVLIKIK